MIFSFMNFKITKCNNTIMFYPVISKKSNKMELLNQIIISFIINIAMINKVLEINLQSSIMNPKKAI